MDTKKFKKLQQKVNKALREQGRTSFSNVIDVFMRGENRVHIVWEQGQNVEYINPDYNTLCNIYDADEHGNYMIISMSEIPTVDKESVSALLTKVFPDESESFYQQAMNAESAYYQY